MPNISSAIMNKVDKRALLAVFRAEQAVADKLVNRLTREQEALHREGNTVFNALNKAALSSKRNFDKRTADLGWKIAAAKKDLEKAEAALAEAKNNLDDKDGECVDE